MLICSKTLDHCHNAADTITLDEIGRYRRRVKMTSDNDISFLLDLPEAKLLHHGQGLQLSDGRVIQVCAMPEKLMEIRSVDARHLLALAWQIGNRHLAAQIEPDRILIRHDHVIKEMLIGLGGEVKDVDAPFSPEGGAYGDQHQAHHHHHD